MPSKSEQDDAAALYDLFRSLDETAEFVSGITREQFLQSALHRAGVAMALQTAGEAVHHLSDATKAQLPEIEWRKIVAFRNRVAHGYFRLNPDRVWLIATEDAPGLRAAIEALRPTEPEA